jgi:hypothetical protein
MNIRSSILGKRYIVCMHQTRRLPAWHTKYAGQLRNSFPPLQYSVAHHSVPERRKNLRRGKGLTSECQMWRGLRSSIAGKVAKNHFKCLGVSCHICCQPKWSGFYKHGKPSTSSTSIIQSNEYYCLHAHDARFRHICHFKRNASAQHNIRNNTPSLP